MVAHAEDIALHVAGRILNESCNLEVGETKSLSFTHHILGKILDAVVAFKNTLISYYIRKTLNKPFVDLSQLLDALHSVTLLKSLCNSEDAEVSGVGEHAVKILEVKIVVPYEPMHPLTDHTQTLLDNLLERLADRHNLAHRFHRRSDLAVNTYEFREVPTRNLHNHIIHRRSHVGRIGSAHLADLVESITQREFCSHKSQGIARSLGSKSGRTAQTSIDLDDTVVISLSIESILNIAFPHDADMANHLTGDILKHCDLLLGERHDRSHYDRFAGMNP